ncbi:DNA alkylation repair protein [Sorangium sp. So ce1000]|uniref:DNA alkylation repair protein n=1 Tax=Sorangium sp. So ce1000 TaxID=3133325 RepID=UPI003F605B57
MDITNVMRDLAALSNDKMREVNARAGDAHGVNLTQLRALAKQPKTDHALAGELWRTGDLDARLLATLVDLMSGSPDPRRA